MAQIALFHPAFTTPGGAEILCLKEAHYLASQGDRVELVTLGFDPAKWTKKLDGIPLRLVPKRHWSDLLSGTSRIAKLRARSRRASEMLAGFEVVVAHNFPCNVMLGATKTLQRKVWQCNEPPRGLHARNANPRLTRQVESGTPGNDESSVMWREILKKHDEALAKNSSLLARQRYDIEQTGKLDFIYAISEFSRDNARLIYGRCGEEVVYPIVQFPEGGRNRTGIDRSALQVLVHGRLETLKNIDTVIRGFALFQKSHTRAVLHVVGEGEARADLERLASQILPIEAVRFHGYLSSQDLRTVYEQCDVFALLTLDEPFGMVYPEAAAKGLLMIGPDHGGPFEILEGGRLGWCVDPFAPHLLAEALEEVVCLPDSEVDRRRTEADHSCRARFSEATIGPKLRKAIMEGQD